MINLLISLGLGTVLFVAVSLWLGPVAAVLPSLFVAIVTMFLLGLRVQRMVEREVAGLTPLLQARNVDAAREHLRRIQREYGRWQFLLDGQLEAQLGMIDYIQMKWDDALPKLEKGRWRNWSAWVAMACIHHRQGRLDQAWEYFAKAAKAGRKESIVYGIWSILLVRAGKRTEALAVLNQGLEAETSTVLKDLKQRIANKKKPDPNVFGDMWFQFFPEELAKKMVMRSRAANAAAANAQPRIGARRAPRR